MSVTAGVKLLLFMFLLFGQLSSHRFSGCQNPNFFWPRIGKLFINVFTTKVYENEGKKYCGPCK